MHRRRAASLVGVLASTLALALPGEAQADDAAENATMPAVSADSLVDSYGVGIHLAFLDTPYKDATAVADALDDLGVRHVRDDLFMENPGQYAAIKTVADRGIRFNLITGSPSSPHSPAEYLDTIATQLPPGAVESVEGTNEWDLFSKGASDWPETLTARQRELYQATKDNPATAHLPVLAPALAFRWNYAELGDLSPYADYANAHMYPGGYRPSNELSQTTAAVRRVVPDKPLITTEAGYHNAVNTSHGHRAVPEGVAAVYLPRMLLEHYLNGERRVYTYELIDEFLDPELTNPEAHFGLLRRDLTPKPAYHAMRNLLSLLDDPGPVFTPRPLAVRLSGYPTDGRFLLTQKRSGQHVLLLWRDVSVYDPVAAKPLSVTTKNIRLELPRASRLTVYQPSQTSAPITQKLASAISLQLGGSVVAVTIDKVDAPQPRYARRVAPPSAVRR